MIEVEKNIEKILVDSLNISSYTGNEEKLAQYFCNIFKRNNFNVEIIQHSENRASLIATYGKPKIAFCTHLDTAIEWQKPKVDNNAIYGIGACDAKASLACQTIVAIELSKKNKDIAIMFLAGEESDSIGAKYILKNPIKSIEYIIHGEPTNCEFITRTASVLELEIKVKGEKGHSSCRNNNISAIHKLLKILYKLEKICKKQDFIFHIGNINGGGTVPSSFPETATAMIQVRGYMKSNEIYDILKEKCKADVTLDILYKNDSCELLTVGGYLSREVLFGSDAGILQNIYKQMLVGPGDINRGHKPDEYILKEELYKGTKCLVDAYHYIEKEM